VQRAKFFRFIDRVEKAYNEAQFSTTPHRLTPEEYVDWSEAANAGFHLKPQTVEDIRAALRRTNPVKWRQIQADMRWIEKHMKKMGLNPEDARYVL
jgi:hypothetical protein